MLEHGNPSPSPPQRVVVLGARGIIGRALTALLEADGIPVLALGSADLDLLDAAAGQRLGGMLRPEDALVVLAALTPDKGRDVATLMKNLRMGEAVAAAMGRGGSAQVIYVSSDAVYRLGPQLVTESTPADPPDLYGAMHKTREVMLTAAVKPERLVILRSTMVLAAHDSHGSYGPNRFRREARASGRITLSGEGEETRDLIALDDLTALLRLLLLYRSRGLVNAASGVSLSFLEMARLVAAQFAAPPEIVFTPRSVPVTHRHFDITALRTAFPAFRLTPHAAAFARVHRAEEP